MAVFARLRPEMALAVAVLACASVPAPFAAAQAAPPLLRVDMRPQAQVAQAQVLLGDVANLNSPDLNLLRRAMALPLGHAPRPGDVVPLDGAQVQRWVQRQTGLQAGQLEWGGAATTDISVATRELPGAELQALAQDALRQHLTALTQQAGHREARIELRATADSAPLALPAGTPTLHLRPLDNAALAPRMLVWVDAFVNGSFVRALPVRFEVSVFARVPVAQGALVAGALLQPAQLAEREVDITRLRDARAWAVAAPLPQRLRRDLQNGEVVAAADVQTQPTVTRGELAHLTAYSGMVTLESRVEVLQDGHTGQMVRVKQVNGNTSLLARVAGPGRLEVQP